MNHPPRLYYLDDIPTPYRLGVFRRVQMLWPGSFRIGFCAESEPGRTFELDFTGLDTETLPGRQWRPAGQVNPISIKWNPTVTRSIAAFKPDVVVLSGYAHPTMMHAARWCLSHAIPYAITCETSAKSTSTSGLRWQIRRCAIGWMVRNMAFGLPVGREAAAYLKMLGSTDAPMHYFPNTPDTTLFRDTVADVEASSGAAKIRARYGLPGPGPLFTFVGRLIAAKRPLDAIEALKRIPEKEAASLLIVGDGVEMVRARDSAAGDPRIVFTGWISDQKELASILAVSAALVLPSAHEPWGAVVNEAMASKACVIATEKVGAALELIEHGADGFVVPVGDVAAIHNAMRTLIDDPARCIRMGEAAQANAIRHGADFAAGNLVAGAEAAVCATAIELRR